MPKMVKISAIDPDGELKFWSGTGWVDRTRKRYPRFLAMEIERDINREGRFTALIDDGRQTLADD